MRRLNLFDLAIIVLLIASLFSFSTKYYERAPVDEYNYTGAQIFNAIRFFDLADGKGFRYLVRVQGSYISDYSPFNEEGIVVGTSQGAFLLKLKDGRILTVGGRTSFREDVAAHNIKVTMLNGSTVHYMHTGFHASDLSEAKNIINNTSKFLDSYGVIETTISGKIAIDGNFPNSVTFESELSNTISNTIFHLKNIKVESSDNGIVLSVIGLGTKDFETLQSILSPFNPSRYYFPDYRTIVLTETIPKSDISLIKGTQMEGLIGEIHVRI